MFGIELTPESFAIVVGLFMPPIISFIKRPEWGPIPSTIASAFVALGVGAAGVALDGGFEDIDTGDTGADVLTAASAAFVAAQIQYNTWFRNSTANDRLTNNFGGSPSP